MIRNVSQLNYRQFIYFLEGFDIIDLYHNKIGVFTGDVFVIFPWYGNGSSCG